MKFKIRSEPDNRQRNFACIVYPDSAPPNWITIIADLKVPAFISPLHEYDVNPDGELKKPHYHIMLMFEGKKSEEQWNYYKSLFGGIGSEIILSKKAYARYLCHLDNPEKHQYSKADVISLCGADYDEVIKGWYNRDQVSREIICYIRENHILTYNQVVDYAMFNNDAWYSYLMDHSLFVKEYLRGRVTLLNIKQKYDEK